MARPKSAIVGNADKMAAKAEVKAVIKQLKADAKEHAKVVKAAMKAAAATNKLLEAAQRKLERLAA